MHKGRQLSLLKDPRKNTKLWWITKQHVYGGSLDYRKVKRPFDKKKLTHAVFKAKLGPSLWFTRSHQEIRKILSRVAVRYGVQLKDLAINKDHIHILFYTKTRESQTYFLRLVAAELGRKYKKIRRNLVLGKARRSNSSYGEKAVTDPVSQSLWVKRPFTRLVSWSRRSLQTIQNYIRRNRDEVLGFVPYTPRHHKLNAFLKSWTGLQPDSA